CTAPSYIYTLSLHDALPIFTLLAGAALLITSFVRLSQQDVGYRYQIVWIGFVTLPESQYPDLGARDRFANQTLPAVRAEIGILRSEEHTSELQSQSNLVCRL